MVWAKPHILMFDNDPVSTGVLARVLAAEFRVQLAPDGCHVLDAARRAGRTPDLILLGVTPPLREGFEICRQLKADEMTRSVPVMLITQRGDADDEKRGLTLGAVACITRPFRLDVVKARVRNQVRLKLDSDLRERYANQDSLTNVANRRRLDLALDVEWRRAMRDEKPLSLLMVEVDWFRQYNNLYGHRVGDQCLLRVAEALARVLTRPGDLLARYAGAKFAIILPSTDQQGALLLGERMRDAIAELNIPHFRQDGVDRVSISVGCASERPDMALTCQHLLQTAEEQLLAARNAGRNCVQAKTTAASSGSGFDKRSLPNQPAAMLKEAAGCCGCSQPS